MGGHKKAISGDHAVWLSQRIKGGDFAIRGLVAELAGEQPEQSVPVLATQHASGVEDRFHVLVFRCFRRVTISFGGARSLDEAPEPAAPVGRQNNVVGAVEDCRCLRRSDRHLGRSLHARPSGACVARDRPPW
jgi:hypothetical protein